MSSVASPLPHIPATDGPLSPGTELDRGRFVLGELLGRGGFGLTYLATDRRLDREVAIKELFPEGARRDGTHVTVGSEGWAAFVGARRRFLREATSLARFGHPNIVRIFAVVEERGTAYIVLERLRGQTLAAELRERRGPFSEAEALDVAGQAAAALSAVHRAGLLHRDVSPSNLMRTSDGRIVLIDFGLARPFDSERTTTMTRVLTPGYAPPEQYDGHGRFAPRADVYALGATLYRLLSERIPPGANDRRRDDVLEPLWRLNANVTHRVSDVVDRALSLDPAARPPSVRALLDELGVDTAGLDLGRTDDSAGNADLDVTVGPVLSPDPRSGSDVPGSERDEQFAAAPSPAQVVVPEPPSTLPASAARASGPPADAGGAPSPDWESAARQGMGRAPAGRRWLTVPLALAGIAIASAQPVTVTLVLALVVAPILATVGDRLVRRHRRSAWILPWGLRNLGVAAGRSVVALIVLVVGVGLWAIVDAIGVVAAGSPWVLRATGLATGWLLSSSIGHGSPTFRSHVALDALTTRLMPRGRPTRQVAIVWLVCLAAFAAGVWFQPEAWPITV